MQDVRKLVQHDVEIAAVHHAAEVCLKGGKPNVVGVAGESEDHATRTRFDGLAKIDGHVIPAAIPDLAPVVFGDHRHRVHQEVCLLQKDRLVGLLLHQVAIALGLVFIGVVKLCAVVKAHAIKVRDAVGKVCDAAHVDGGSALHHSLGRREVIARDGLCVDRGMRRAVLSVCAVCSHALGDVVKHRHVGNRTRRAACAAHTGVAGECRDKSRKEFGVVRIDSGSTVAAVATVAARTREIRQTAVINDIRAIAARRAVDTAARYGGQSAVSG